MHNRRIWHYVTQRYVGQAEQTRIAGGVLLLEPRGQRPPRGLVRRGCG